MFNCRILQCTGVQYCTVPYSPFFTEQVVFLVFDFLFGSDSIEVCPFPKPIQEAAAVNP